MTEGRREPSPAPPSEPDAEPGPDAGPEPRTGSAQARIDLSEHPDCPAGDDDPERVGPLLVERHRKADGRPLILYRGATDDDG
jgi:hypothetical protein